MILLRESAGLCTWAAVVALPRCLVGLVRLAMTVFQASTAELMPAKIVIRTANHRQLHRGVHVILPTLLGGKNSQWQYSPRPSGRDAALLRIGEAEP